MRHGAWLLLVALLCVGCARFDEAFRDRITERSPAVALACPALPAVKQVAASQPVTIEASAAPITNAVGPLFDWSAVSSTMVRVSVLPESPNHMLFADLGTLVQRAGYRVTAGSRPMVVGFAYLMVESLPGRWYELKGTIRARVAFRVGDNHVGGGVFRGEHAIRVAYFYSSDMEAALQAAYCAALAQFARCLETGACLTGESE